MWATGRRSGMERDGSGCRPVKRRRRGSAAAAARHRRRDRASVAGVVTAAAAAAVPWRRASAGSAPCASASVKAAVKLSPAPTALTTSTRGGDGVQPQVPGRGQNRAIGAARHHHHSRRRRARPGRGPDRGFRPRSPSAPPASASASRSSRRSTAGRAGIGVAEQPSSAGPRYRRPAARRARRAPAPGAAGNRRPRPAAGCR
jgi:hypothetical protein